MTAIRSFPLLLGLAAGLLVAGCGDDDDGPSAPAQTADGLPVPEPMRSFKDDSVAEIAIDGTDQMKYSIEEFSVKPGQMVRITLEHVGNLPVDSMGHNVVIIEQGEDYMEFTADANEAGAELDNDYLPAAVRDRVIAYTDMIGGGETTTVEFKAPEKAGEYPFLCTFPGHASQMNGIMKVGG